MITTFLGYPSQNIIDWCDQNVILAGDVVDVDTLQRCYQTVLNVFGSSMKLKEDDVKDVFDNFDDIVQAYPSGQTYATADDLKQLVANLTQYTQDKGI